MLQSWPSALATVLRISRLAEEKPRQMSIKHHLKRKYGAVECKVSGFMLSVSGAPPAPLLLYRLREQMGVFKSNRVLPSSPGKEGYLKWGTVAG